MDHQQSDRIVTSKDCITKTSGTAEAGRGVRVAECKGWQIAHLNKYTKCNKLQFLC